MSGQQPELLVSGTSIPRLPQEWNSGVFRSVIRGRRAVADRGFARDGNSVGLPPSSLMPADTMDYRALKLTVSQEYNTLNERLNHAFDIAGFEPIDAPIRSKAEKQSIYDFQPKGSDVYPPHLNHIPPKDATAMTTIFNKVALAQTALVMYGLWTHYTTPDPIYKVKNIDEIIANDRKFRKAEREVFSDTNIGDRDDWFSDDVFAQQQFTGTNPISITSTESPQANKWVELFKGEAAKQSREDVVDLMEAADSSLYVADYSYFREAVGVAPDAELNSGPSTDKNDRVRYTCASVGLFNLTPEGKLHPVAIIIDYRGSMDKSVTIFNKCLVPGGNSIEEQKNDYPWRYAKTALCSADWLHHEAKVHLTDTHLIEECIIVATHRAFNDTGPIFNLLEPHWDRTLSLNKAARDILVPSVVTKLAGIPEKAVHKYINVMYENFDWEGGYIPNDLKNRGFPLEELDDPKGKFHNYAYARNMKSMWQILRNFVAGYLSAFNDYDTDDQIAEDEDIQYWCSEIRSPDRGNIKNFPEIKTRDQLIDALTMCIHIASPQHTAINYLQRYYMALVINKPPAFATPPPADLKTLNSYTQQSLFNALPVQTERQQQYMLASHLPWLLSYQVASTQTLLNYATTLKNHTTRRVKTVAAQFEADLIRLSEEFKEHSSQLDDKQLEYHVMDPEVTAVSILI